MIQPAIVGRSVDLTPPTTMVAAFVGAAIAGVPGALVAIPTRRRDQGDLPRGTRSAEAGSDTRAASSAGSAAGAPPEVTSRSSAPRRYTASTLPR